MESLRRTERGYDRLVNFSDAVVAIAITLLVLPLVDLVSELDRNDAEADVWHLISENTFRFGAFALTFVVTTVFWMIHHRMFELIAGYDYTLVWLNTLWLAFVVLLPFTSGVVSETGFEDGAGLLYCGTMGLLSLSQGFISMYAKRHPELLASGVSPSDFTTRRAWIFFAFFVSVGLVSLWVPEAGSWLLLLLIPLGRVIPR